MVVHSFSIFTSSKMGRNPYIIIRIHMANTHLSRRLIFRFSLGIEEAA